MKKISILTFFFSHNYGAVLQAYSMGKLLQQQGFEVEFIDLRVHSANIKPRFPRNIRDLFMLYKYFSIKLFLAKYFPEISQPVRSLDELKTYRFHSDIFLVGSDQVWGMKHIGDAYGAFFFDFVPDNVPKIAFAASFGVSEWSKEISETVTAEVKSLLQRFQYIGVREKSGVDICKNVFNADATHVLDPTLLAGNFHSLTGDLSNKGKRRIFRYFIHQNSEINAEIDKITELVSGFTRLSKWNNIKYIKYKNPKEWVEMIGTSEFIITDSFHVCCFSIIYRKQFMVYITKRSVSTRIISLLEELGLTGRIVYSSKELETANLWKGLIDYDEVHAKLQILKEGSLSELQKALNTDGYKH